MHSRDVLKLEEKAKTNKRYVCVVTDFNIDCYWWCSCDKKSEYMLQYDFLLGSNDYERFHVWDKKKKKWIFGRDLRQKTCKGCEKCE